MANIVCRSISTRAREGCRARGGYHTAFGNPYVEDNSASVLRFPPHAEMAGEALTELVPGLLVGGDGQANGRGGVRIGRFADQPAIAFPQQARDNRQCARATYHV